MLDGLREPLGPSCLLRLLDENLSFPTYKVHHDCHTRTDAMLASTVPHTALRLATRSPVELIMLVSAQLPAFLSSVESPLGAGDRPCRLDHWSEGRSA